VYFLHKNPREHSFSHQFLHRRQVPNVDHGGPAGHQLDDVLEVGHFGAVPKGVAQPCVVFDGHRVHQGALDFKAALFEHHYRRVVDAGAFGEDQNRHVGLVANVLLQAGIFHWKNYHNFYYNWYMIIPLSNGHAIVGFGSLEPDMGRGPA